MLTLSLEQNVTIQLLESAVIKELKELTWLSEDSDDSCKERQKIRQHATAET